MPMLMVMRHAKSSWSDATTADHDRPLNTRGRSAAGDMGRFAARNGLLPDVVLASDSRRTRETVELWADAADWHGPVDHLPELYHASAAGLLEVARLARAEMAGADRVMLVAHNPGIEDLVSTVCDDLVTVPTGTLAVMEHASDDLDPSSLRLVGIQRPRDLVD